jgi:hypothetical protein
MKTKTNEAFVELGFGFAAAEGEGGGEVLPVLTAQAVAVAGF